MKGGIDLDTCTFTLLIISCSVSAPGSDSHSICWIPAGGGRYYMCYLPNLLESVTHPFTSLSPPIYKRNSGKTAIAPLIGHNDLAIQLHNSNNDVTNNASS